MPQWSRQRDDDSTKYPDERARADCPRALVPLLLRYDHHVVWIGGRAALLRTYQWAAAEHAESLDGLPFEVSFTYARGHPTAPPEVQDAVASMTFMPVEA